MKPTILIFSKGYLPGTKFGGPVTSLKNFSDVFINDYNIKIVTLNHDFKCNERYNDIKTGWNRVGSADVLYLSDRESNYTSFKNIIETEEPLFCYLSGTITSYFGFNEYVIKICNINNIPVILVPRGDICNNALKIKRFKKLLAIILCRSMNSFRNIYFQTTINEETENLIKYFNIEEKKIFEVPNVPANIKNIKPKKKKVGELKLVFVSRIAYKKNLLDAIKSVNSTKNNILFDIYGPLEDEKYWKECKAQIDLAPSNVVIQYKGALDLIKAKTIFQEYDAFLFETRSENYGHVIVESLLCGCPVILTKKTTPWDDLDKIAGYTAELGDISEFSRIIDSMADMNSKQFSELRKKTQQYAIEKTNIDNVIKQYHRMFYLVMDKYNKSR